MIRGGKKGNKNKEKEKEKGGAAENLEKQHVE